MIKQLYLSWDWEEFIRKRVKCCACDGTMGNSEHINMIQLDRKANWKFPTAANILSSDVRPRAMSVVCDKCVNGKCSPKYAIEWNQKTRKIRYHKVDGLENLPAWILDKSG